MRMRPTARLPVLALLGVLLMSVLPANGARAATELGLITGGEKGTYYQFGLDLQRLGKERGSTSPSTRRGGPSRTSTPCTSGPPTQLGIVQSDVLAFVSRVQSDETLKRIAKKTKMVFPLYNEEIHLLGRNGIAGFDDLADRRVAIGREGSGTYLTARLLFKVSEVQPKEMVPIDTDQALAELKAGRIDAMFYVAGYPVKLLTEGVTAEDNLTLVPITNKSITEFYPRAEIPAAIYAWQPAAVNTVAVKAVLISFDFRRKDCDAIGQFAQVVSTNLPWLVRNGHPKWKAVDVDAPLKGWEQYDCVARFLRKPGGASAPSPKPSSLNPVMDAIKDLLND